MERFLAGFLQSEVAGDYVIVGHSVGGGVGIEHALVSPSKRLKGLVLLATGARLRVHPMILQLFDQVAEAGVVHKEREELLPVHLESNHVTVS